MRSRAAAENLCAWTVSGLDRSPLARILTGTSLRLPRPLAARASSVTSAPLSKRFSRSERLTGWVCVRKGSKGMDFFMCGPRSLRIRMWIGIWPPSKFTRVFEPEREPAPFWPRPEVLPVPEPSPRPTRLRVLREPGAGLRVCSPTRGVSSAIGDLHQVADPVDHAPDLLVVLDLDRLADLAQAERAQRLALRVVGAVLRLDLRHLHGAASSAPAGASPSASSAPSPAATAAGSAGSSPFPVAGGASSSSACRPRTALTLSPRSSATSSGRRRPCRPAIVALTRLIGFCVPSDLERMSWIPASSSTARTPPPAMTPVPGEAGLRKTRPEP